MQTLLIRLSLLALGVVFAMAVFGVAPAMAHGSTQASITKLSDAPVHVQVASISKAANVSDCDGSHSHTPGQKDTCYKITVSCCATFVAATPQAASILYSDTIRHDRRLADMTLASAVPDQQLRPPRILA